MASDDPHQLACMLLDAADISNDDIRRSCTAIDDAAKPVINLPVTAASPRGKTFGENFGRRHDRDHHDIGIGPTHRVDHRARYIGDHGAPGADFVIDLAWQGGAVTM